MKTNLIAPLAISLLILSGCSTIKHSGFTNFTTNNMVNNTAPSALQIISQESQKALIAQQMLTKYRQNYSDTLDTVQRSFENDKMVVDYIGKPQGILASMAIKYGYRFLETGVKRDLPTVNFTQVYTTPEDLIIAIDSQLDSKAKISLDKPNKTITLMYNE